MIKNKKDSQKVLNIYNSLIDNEENYISSLTYSDKGFVFAKFLFDVDYKIKEGFSNENKFNYIIIETDDEEKLNDKISNQEYLEMEKNENEFKLKLL